MIEYLFQTGEPGIFVELYLPKKAELQGALYETLTAGLDVTNLHKHFRDESKQQAIVKLLNAHYPEVSNFTEEMIQQFPAKMFIGYSMYEVDGVFYNDKSKKIAEERTQVIRLMFVYEGYDPGCLHIIKSFLRAPDSRVSTFSTQTALTEGQRVELVKAERWVDYVAMFIFGYVIVEICRRIEECCAQDSSTSVKQDELWVVSFWNLVLNRIIDTSERK